MGFCLKDNTGYLTNSLIMFFKISSGSAGFYSVIS